MAATNPQSPADAALAAEIRRLNDALALADRDRQLLGFEIHDGIVQDLAAAAMLLEAAGSDAKFASPERAENYAGGLRLMRGAVGEARRIIRGLALVEQGEQGLTTALGQLVQKFRSDMGVPVTFTCEAGDLKLPASMQHLLLRIVQEALFNVWKHSQATQVELVVRRGGQQLELSIADNGSGFDPQSASAGHFGIASMRARAQVLGATLDIDSAPGQGTRIVVRLKAPPAV